MLWLDFARCIRAPQLPSTSLCTALAMKWVNACTQPRLPQPRAPMQSRSTNASILKSEAQKAALEALVEVRRETLQRAFNSGAIKVR